MRSRVVLAIVVVSLTACGDDEPETNPATCQDYADVSGNPSFATDVMPIFQLSCGLSTSCHQSPSGKEELSLGPPVAITPMQPDIDAVHAAIVGTASLTRSSLPLVDPGNPAGSWLLAKIEYEGAEFAECDTSSQCGSECGDRMPQGSSKMERARIDIIAAWIKSGAANN
jgi:hypothetical protein